MRRRSSHRPTVGWPAGRTSRPRARRRRRATGRVTGDRGAGDADTPMLPPPPPAMPPVVVVVPSVPSVPTRVAVVVGGGASSATAGTRGATDEQDEERNAERPATRRPRRKEQAGEVGMWVKMKGRKLQSRRATAQHARGPRNIAEHREGGGKHLHGDRASGRERRAIGRAVFVAARSKLALCLVNRRKESS